SRRRLKSSRTNLFTRVSFKRPQPSRCMKTFQLPELTLDFTSLSISWIRSNTNRGKDCLCMRKTDKHRKRLKSLRKRMTVNMRKEIVRMQKDRCILIYLLEVVDQPCQKY